jgi:phosphoribosylformimino-5-aminoimidazole carboxamide ribotide isomerase
MLALEIDGDRLRPRGGEAALRERARGADALDAAREAVSHGIRHLYVVDVNADGRMGGPPLRFLDRLADTLSDGEVSLHVGGGVRDVADVRELARFGVRSIVIGRALREGLLQLLEAQRIADEASPWT